MTISTALLYTQETCTALLSQFPTEDKLLKGALKTIQDLAAEAKRDCKSAKAREKQNKNLRSLTSQMEGFNHHILRLQKELIGKTAATVQKEEREEELVHDPVADERENASGAVVEVLPSDIKQEEALVFADRVVVEAASSDVKQDEADPEASSSGAAMEIESSNGSSDFDPNVVFTTSESVLKEKDASGAAEKKQEDASGAAEEEFEVVEQDPNVQKDVQATKNGQCLIS